MSRKLWMIGLAIWLILFGILAVTNIRFDFQSTVMGILAIVVGALILFDK